MADRDDMGPPSRLSPRSSELTEPERSEHALASTSESHALVESQERFRLLVDHAPVGIAVHAEGKIVFSNEAGARLLGAKSAADLVGLPVERIVPPERWSRARERFERLLAGETGLYPLEDVCLRLDGSRVDVEVMAVPMTLGGKAAIQVIVTDITERKATKEALARAELGFRSLLNEVSDVVWAASPDGREYYYLSPSVERVYGRPRDAFLANPGLWLEAIHPDDRDAVMRRTGRLAIDGRLEDEYRIVRPDGEIRWLRDRKSMVRDAQGEPVQMGGIASDVTERRLAEAALRASEERHRTLVEHLPQRIFVKDRDSVYLSCNANYARDLGIVPEQIVGLDDFAFFAPELAERYRADDRAVIAAGQIKDIEEPYRVAGREQWIRTLKIPYHGPSGEIVGVLGIFEDISERKRAEDDLRKSEAILQESQRAARIGNWTYDLAGGVTWSEEMYRLFDVSPTAYTPDPESFEALAHPDDRGAMASWMTDCMQEGRPRSLDLRRILGDGSMRVITVRGDMVYDAAGKPLCLAGTAQDITERRRAEDEQARLTRQLQVSQRLEAVGRLAGGVAHDFNNLLAVISGCADFVREGLREADPLRDDVDEIRAAADRAVALTRQLLAFSRMQVLKPEVIDLNQVTTNLDKMLRRLIGEDIELALESVPDLGRVKADPGQVEQAITNLVVNARDAMPFGGKITVATANVAHDGISTPGIDLPSGSYVRLAISDTGSGMDQETTRLIFEPFFTTKEMGKGTGLGLSTTFGIIKQSGGDISVDSTPGVGTRFDIYLPRVYEDLPSAMRPSGGVVEGTETVLVVEDEAAVRRVVERTLGDAGYRVLSAMDGRDALAKYAAFGADVDLLLTDVVMRGMSGRAVAEALAALQPGIKVLFMSGYTDDAIAHHGVLGPDVRLISKPFSAKGLTRRVREILDGGS